MDMDRHPEQLIYSAIGNDAEARYPLRSPATRLPGGRASMFGYSGQSPGVSRKEFVRLDYGVFKEAGEEEALVESLQREIDKRENRLRRLQARIRFHQGHTVLPFDATRPATWWADERSCSQSTNNQMPTQAR